MKPIDLTTDDPDPPQNDDNPINSNGKRSWVWTHFNPTACGKKLQCTVISKSGKECGALLARDARSSTKGMCDHLIAKHNLGDPNKKSKQMGMIEQFASTGKNPKLVIPISILSSFSFHLILIWFFISFKAPLDYCVSKDINLLLYMWLWSFFCNDWEEVLQNFT